MRSVPGLVGSERCAQPQGFCSLNSLSSLAEEEGEGVDVSPSASQSLPRTEVGDGTPQGFGCWPR